MYPFLNLSAAYRIAGARGTPRSQGKLVGTAVYFRRTTKIDAAAAGKKVVVDQGMVRSLLVVRGDGGAAAAGLGASGALGAAHVAFATAKESATGDNKWQNDVKSKEGQWGG